MKLKLTVEEIAVIAKYFREFEPGVGTKLSDRELVKKFVDVETAVFILSKVGK